MEISDGYGSIIWCSFLALVVLFHIFVGSLVHLLCERKRRYKKVYRLSRVISIETKIFLAIVSLRPFSTWSYYCLDCRWQAAIKSWVAY